METITIRVLYTSRRRAHDDVKKLGLLDGPIERAIFVHPDGVYIRVVAPSRLEEQIRAILLYGEEAEAMPSTIECSEYYAEGAIPTFQPQRRPARRTA
jgi:hypothetical protein